MRYLPIIILALTVTGCATYSATQPYRDAAGQKYQITGHVEELSFKTQININNTEVINGQLSMMGSGVLEGTYQGKPVVADCNLVRRGGDNNQLICQISIDGEHATNLTF
jgi:hypothetical protein